MAGYKSKMGIEEDKDDPAYWREKDNRRLLKPGKYDSIRPAGEEERLSNRKSEGLKQAAMGIGIAPFTIGLETALGGFGNLPKDQISKPAAYLTDTGNRLAKSVKETSDFVGSGVNQYKNAKEQEAALDRELENQTKRESRGMKKGGVVSASKRADGIAQRGKTRGKMV